MQDAGWPRFELVTIGIPPDVARPVADALAATGVPRGLIGHEYRALETATPLTAVGQGVVAFGASGLRGRICLEMATPLVLHVPDPTAPVRNHVNAGLRQFVASVAAVIERFPFYGDDSELEERERAAAEISAVLSAIDPSALAHQGFWPTFIDDLTIGDYSPEEILG